MARLVCAAQLGLVDEAYRAAEGARLGPVAASTDIMVPDGYRTALLFQASMPELRNDLRFPQLRARLGLVEFWLATGRWPRLRRRGALRLLRRMRRCSAAAEG